MNRLKSHQKCRRPRVRNAFTKTQHLRCTIRKHLATSERNANFPLIITAGVFAGREFLRSHVAMADKRKENCFECQTGFKMAIDRNAAL